jgi:hypothetical protein
MVFTQIDGNFKPQRFCQEMLPMQVKITNENHILVRWF